MQLSLRITGTIVYDGIFAMPELLTNVKPNLLEELG
jgi:hypothetical protein